MLWGEAHEDEGSGVVAHQTGMCAGGFQQDGQHRLLLYSGNLNLPLPQPNTSRVTNQHLVPNLRVLWMLFRHVGFLETKAADITTRYRYKN
jgi:hypothetical protein